MAPQPQAERRQRQAAIPAHLEQVLNALQLQTLHQMENFGWELEFIRRPLFAPVVPVLLHHDNQHVAVIRDDGELDTEPEIELRH